MGRTACTEPQCLYRGTLYLYLYPLRIYRWAPLKQLPTNLVSRLRMCLMWIRFRPISGHRMIHMLSRTLGIETSSAWKLGLLSSGTLSWSSILIPHTSSAQWYEIFCELLYWSGFKICLQLWGRGCVSTTRNSCIVWGIYTTVVEHDNPIVPTWCMGFGHWIPWATASEIYLKNQSH
jgi:hypothetical protein